MRALAVVVADPIRDLCAPILRVAIREQELGRKAERQLLPTQPGESRRPMPTSMTLPATSISGRRIEDGIRRFAAWYRS
jgi:hypothetical protein